MNFLTGKKTYIIAIGMILYAALGYAFHYVPGDMAWSIVLQALAIAGLRKGIATSTPTQ